MKALSGTWLPPLLKTCEDADFPPLKGVLADETEDSPAEVATPTAVPAVAAATEALDGPKPAVFVDPPETNPAPPEDELADERM